MLGNWFHRGVNGIQAEKLLQKYGQDGSFLIRLSERTVNNYTLSVRCGNQYKHIVIQNNGDGYEFCEGGEKFDTLAELVDYFIMKETLRDRTDGSMLVLKYPLSCQEPTSKRYFHGTISGSEAINLLLSEGRPGSYLVRESRTHPENYVLNVRCDNDKIVQFEVIYTPRGYTMHNFDIYLHTLDDFIDECIKLSPIVEAKDNVVILHEPLNSTRVNALNMNTRVEELDRYVSQDTKTGFAKEFELLQYMENNLVYDQKKEGAKPENRDKNRFKSILPFDRNRVRLQGRSNNSDDPSSSDYINANKIESDHKFGKVYLATQGPLTNTIADFWSMIWQEECQIILMITHEEEKGRVKCARYWPETSGAFVNENINYVNLQGGLTATQPLKIPNVSEESNSKNKSVLALSNNKMTSRDNFASSATSNMSQSSDPSVAVYGDIKVKFLSLEKINDDYVLRKFLVAKSEPGTSSMSTSSSSKSKISARIVYHFQYLAWSDHGVPENVQNTLAFINHVNKLYNEQKVPKPITVHCSAGIGRTGAIILIDLIIDKIKAFGLQCDIDICKTAAHLRSQRSGMIQTEKQYRFLYIAIKNYIDNCLMSLPGPANATVHSNRSRGH